MKGSSNLLSELPGDPDVPDLIMYGINCIAKHGEGKSEIIVVCHEEE